MLEWDEGEGEGGEQERDFKGESFQVSEREISGVRVFKHLRERERERETTKSNAERERDSERSGGGK